MGNMRNVCFLSDNDRRPCLAVFRDIAKAFPADQSAGDSTDRIDYSGTDCHAGAQRDRIMSDYYGSDHGMADKLTYTDSGNHRRDVGINCKVPQG